MSVHDLFSASIVFPGHAGGCGSFYAITIASKDFKDVPMLKQHKMVNGVLKDEISGIHGLQVRSVLRLPGLESLTHLAPVKNYA